MTFGKIVFLISALALVAHPVRADAQTPPPPQPDVSSTNQSGGNTAGVINIYESKKTDPERQRLAETLVSFNGKVGKMLDGSDPNQANVFFWEGRADPARRVKTVMVTVMAFPGTPSDEDMACGPDAPFSAIAFRASVATVGKNRNLVAETATMDDDAAVRKICEGLKKPLSYLTQRPPSPSPNGARTVFDYLLLRTKDGKGVGVVLMAFTPEQARLDVENYWKPGVMMIHQGDPAAFQPELTPELADDLPDEGPMQANFPIPDSMLSSTGEGYPASILKEFDGEIERLQVSWLEYLKTSQVTVRGVPRPLLADNKPLSPHRVYSTEEIGSREFWLSAGDTTSVARQMNCIGSRFLVDQKYAAQSDVPNYSRCAVSEIRIAK